MAGWAGRAAAARRLAGGLLPIAAAAALAGCGSGAGGSHERLAYLIFTGYTPPYFAPLADAVQDADRRTGGLRIRVLSAGGSASTEVTDLNEASAAGADGILLNPIDESVSYAAKQVTDSGVPVIAIDRDLSSPAARAAFVGANDERMGEVSARRGLRTLARRHVPKPWRVVILQGTLGSSTAIDRYHGARRALAPYLRRHQAKIILNQAADFDTAQAQSLMSEFLAKSPDVQLVIAGNDAMALGAIDALEGHHIPLGRRTFVTGIDGQPESLLAIRQGRQLDTVTHSPYIEGVWSVEALDARLTRGLRPPPGRFPHGTLKIPSKLVTKRNVARITSWATPKVVPALPYGGFQPFPVPPAHR